MFNGLTILL